MHRSLYSSNKRTPARYDKFSITQQLKQDQSTSRLPDDLRRLSIWCGDRKKHNANSHRFVIDFRNLTQAGLQREKLTATPWPSASKPTRALCFMIMGPYVERKVQKHEAYFDFPAVWNPECVIAHKQIYLRRAWVSLKNMRDFR